MMDTSLITSHDMLDSFVGRKIDCMSRSYKVISIFGAATDTTIYLTCTHDHTGHSSPKTQEPLSSCNSIATLNHAIVDCGGSGIEDLHAGLGHVNNEATHHQPYDTPRTLIASIGYITVCSLRRISTCDHRR